MLLADLPADFPEKVATAWNVALVASAVALIAAMVSALINHFRLRRALSKVEEFDIRWNEHSGRLTVSTPAPDLKALADAINEMTNLSDDDIATLEKHIRSSRRQ